MSKPCPIKILVAAWDANPWPMIPTQTGSRVADCRTGEVKERGRPPTSEALGQARDGGDQDRAEYKAHDAYRGKDKYSVIRGPHRRAAPDWAPSPAFVYSSIWRSPIELPKAAFALARKVVVQRQLGLPGHSQICVDQDSAIISMLR